MTSDCCIFKFLQCSVDRALMLFDKTQLFKYNEIFKDILWIKLIVWLCSKLTTIYIMLPYLFHAW